METTVTYLEMTDPADLRPAPAIAAMSLQAADRTSPLIRSTRTRVGEAYGWNDSLGTDEQWTDWLAHPLRQYWLIMLHGEVAGIADLEPQPDGDMEISTFGLLPEHLGKGLGGYALTLVIWRAWATRPVDTSTVRRVWLHTAGSDHPHALRNYERRGFRAFRTADH